jgi:hypothetical protein
MLVAGKIDKLQLLYDDSRYYEPFVLSDCEDLKEFFVEGICKSMLGPKLQETFPDEPNRLYLKETKIAGHRWGNVADLRYLDRGWGDEDYGIVTEIRRKWWFEEDLPSDEGSEEEKDKAWQLTKTEREEKIRLLEGKLKGC